MNQLTQENNHAENFSVYRSQVLRKNSYILTFKLKEHIKILMRSKTLRTLRLTASAVYIPRLKVKVTFVKRTTQ